MTIFRSILKQLAETLEAKNRAYGDSVHRLPIFAPNASPEEAAWIRLGDKVARLESLLRCAQDAGETINDTLLDLAGYAVILLSMRGWCNERGISCDEGDLEQCGE